MAWFFREAQHARLYQKYRPVYPREVFETIYDCLSDVHVRQWNLAIDVCCGTGLGTLPLCDHFDKVIGVDQSEAQLNEARKDLPDAFKEKVTYVLGDAHDLSFQPDSSVDLITIAQSLHWLDVVKFCKESLRVLRNGGVLAAYSHATQLKNVHGQEILTKVLYIL